jgi:hypothetical protein
MFMKLGFLVGGTDYRANMDGGVFKKKGTAGVQEEWKLERVII